MQISRLIDQRFATDSKVRQQKIRVSGTAQIEDERLTNKTTKREENSKDLMSSMIETEE